ARFRRRPVVAARAPSPACCTTAAPIPDSWSAPRTPASAPAAAMTAKSSGTRKRATTAVVTVAATTPNQCAPPVQPNPTATRARKFTSATSPERYGGRNPVPPAPDCSLGSPLIRRAEMARKLFVGNLAYGVTEDELREVFGAIGACESVSIVMDRDTGQSRGFGFVTMASNDDADRAKKQLDGTDLKGRRLRVDDANDQSTRAS